MDVRLLKHYESELSYLREMGAEFAVNFPKIAARLGMDGIEVADPYVERLLEGTAFLAARVQLELELQNTALTSNLLEIIYPHYLSPTPSMTVVSLVPDGKAGSLSKGYVFPRGTQLRSTVGDGVQTACLFRTSHDLTLWPIEVAEAEYIESRGQLVAAGVTRDVEARAGIRLRLRRSDGGKISDLPVERLTFFMDPQGGRSWTLHELLSSGVTGVFARSTDRRDDWSLHLNSTARPVGFDRDEALLPTPLAAFDGYRLLQEYFAMPERFHFVEFDGLGPAFRKSKGADVDLYILLRDASNTVAQGVNPQAFSLTSVPAVNLFTKRCDRIHVSSRDIEHHVVADRTAPLDFEVHTLTDMVGISGDGSPDVDFRPFYSADDFTAAGDVHQSYYTIRRRMRQRSEKERLRGVRTTYLGSETYVSLVDRKQAPYRADINQLAVTALCSNRDLPLLLATGGGDVLHLPDGGPVSAVRLSVPPTRPRPTLAQGDGAWRLISHLSLNYLSIADTSQGGGHEALRELLGIYAPSGDRVVERQLEGLVSVDSRPIVRRIEDKVLSTAVRGLEIRLGFDESFFEGTSAYLLGAVLQRFFQKYATINSFTQTVLTTQQRGEIARWRPESGLGRII